MRAACLGPTIELSVSFYQVVIGLSSITVSFGGKAEINLSLVMLMLMWHVLELVDKTELFILKSGDVKAFLRTLVLFLQFVFMFSRVFGAAFLDKYTMNNPIFSDST